MLMSLSYYPALLDNPTLFFMRLVWHISMLTTVFEKIAFENYILLYKLIQMSPIIVHYT